MPPREASCHLGELAAALRQARPPPAPSEARMLRAGRAASLEPLDARGDVMAAAQVPPRAPPGPSCSGSAVVPTMPRRQAVSAGDRAARRACFGLDELVAVMDRPAPLRLLRGAVARGRSAAAMEPLEARGDGKPATEVPLRAPPRALLLRTHGGPAAAWSRRAHGGRGDCPKSLLSACRTRCRPRWDYPACSHAHGSRRSCGHARLLSATGRQRARRWLTTLRGR